MRRTYSQQKTLPPLAPVPSSPKSDFPAWIDGLQLHALPQASQILSERLGSNYSVHSLRSRITSGIFGEAGDVWVYDGSYKINIHNFLKWRSQNPDERKLKQQIRRRKRGI